MPRVCLLLLLTLGFCSALQIQINEERVVQSSLEAAKPSISVFVFSRVDGIDRRARIRNLWLRAKESKEIDVTYQFAVCGGTSGELRVPSDAGDGSVVPATAEVKSALDKEMDVHKDVLYLDCDEGYGEGALTKKVLASMKHYWANHKSDYFMKIDDDSFLAWSKYAPRLLKVGHGYVYMGIPIGEGVPCRNKDFRWYEPYTTFSKPLFPKGMSGGSGYTIGNKLVDIILHQGIGEANVLFNEDRSVGVWMDTIVKSGIKVDYEGVSGIDGFWAWNWEHPTELWATWDKYPYVVHHGLEGDTIACLAAADFDALGSKPISDCFKPEVGKHYEPLKCASLNKEAQDMQKQARDQEWREQHNL